jgi:hypothetical protein
MRNFGRRGRGPKIENGCESHGEVLAELDREGVEERPVPHRKRWPVDGRRRAGASALAAALAR